MGYKVKRFSQIEKQKDFGMLESTVNGVRDVAGNVVEGAGKIVGSGLGKTVAGGFGMMKGAGLGAAALGSVVPILGHAVGAIGGGLLGGMLGKKAAEVGGDTLKSVGQDIHS